MQLSPNVGFFEILLKRYCLCLVTFLFLHMQKFVAIVTMLNLHLSAKLKNFMTLQSFCLPENLGEEENGLLEF